MQRKNKYNNTPINNYRSKAEYAHSLYLESEKQAGRIKKIEYEKQYEIVLKKRGQKDTHICYMLPDFTLTMPDGSKVVHEVKGGRATETDVWRLKMKLFKFCFPNIRYEVHRIKSWKPRRFPSIDIDR